MSLSAADLEREYGPLLRKPPLSECTSPRYLHTALDAKRIKVIEGVVKQWIMKYRTEATHVKSTKDLHEEYGAELQALPQEKKTPFGNATHLYLFRILSRSSGS